MITIAKTSSLFGQICNGHTIRVFRHVTRPPSSKTLGQEPRFNPLGIEMLPDRLHKQVFGTNEEAELWRHHGGPSKDNLKKCIQHLRRHDLLPKQLSEVDTVYEYHKHLSANIESRSDNQSQTLDTNDVVIDIPRLEGKNINQHFQTLGENYSKVYKRMACDIIKNGPDILENMPREWDRATGWTRYEPCGDGGFRMTQVDYPTERTLVFDVETCMNDTIEHAPTMAVAVSEKAWYSWTSPRLFEYNEELNKTKTLTTNDLIRFQSSINEEKLIIGHNVGFDRSFLSDQYNLSDSKTKFLDTLSLHMCICGLTGLQRAVKVAHKRKLKEEGSINPDDIENSPWIEKSSLNNLADVYEFHCGEKLLKDEREIFVEGSMEDIRVNYQSLMTYCANDVKATFNVFKTLFSTFTDRFPHPVTLAGMLEMSTMYLPLYVSKWSKYIQGSQSVFDEFEQQLSCALQELADDTCGMTKDEYSRDVWMWDADWSTQTIKPNKAKLQAWLKLQQTRNADEKVSIEEKVQEIYDTKSFMRRIPPFLPGFPKWYRDLCCPINKTGILMGDKEWQPGPCLISTQMRITPKLMRLTWNGYPLHHHIKHGWGFLVPNGDIVAGHVDLPDDHPYKNFPINELRKLCRNLSKSPIFLEEEEDGNFREDMVNARISELKDSTQMSSPNLIKLLKKLSKKRKIAPRFRGEYCEDVEIPGAYFIRLPHKNGTNFNVGNPLGRDFVAKMEDGTLSSFDNNLANLLLKQSLSLSYWKNNNKRIRGQMVVVRDEQNDLGAILPRVIVAGTVTRRAVEPTWLTASNQDTTRVGSELKAIIQSPPGYCFVGADVDSQELWIASLMGDSYSYKIHGGTGLSYMTLRGSKSEKTDMHSKTASLIGITRDDAKVLNYARIYGAGQKFIERFLMNTNPNLNSEQAKEKAKTIFKETKGERKFRSRTYWEGGTESATFNKLEEIASSAKPRTPVLDCQISQALEPEQDQAKDFVTSRVNWVVQSSAVDFLHLLLVNMKWLFERLNIDGRFAISIHDEVRYLVKEEDKYKAAFALQVSNLLVRSYFAYRLNMKDLPISVAFFSSVDIDKCLRKEVNMDCKSPSNPYGLKEAYNIPHGESLDIRETLRNNQSPSSVESELYATLKPESEYFSLSSSEPDRSSIIPRRQHTLQSLSIQSPRSRSPIVYNHLRERQPHTASSTFVPTCYKMDGDKELSRKRDDMLEARRLSLNPFELSTNSDSSAINHQTAIAPLISPESFERRRSVYEPSVCDQKIMNDIGSGCYPQLTRIGSFARCDNHDEPALANSGELHNEDLSLDEILNKIQEGGLQLIDSEGSASETKISSSDRQQQATELQEFRRSDQSQLRKDNCHKNLVDAEKSIVTSSFAQANSSSFSSLTTCADQPPSLIDGEQQVVTLATRRRSRDEKARQNERATGFEIAWLDFTYSIEPNVFEDPRWGKINSLFHKERRMILKGLSGGLRSGQMVALMGPSGAGKTCLLESISGVRTTGIGGRMCLRGRKKAQLVIVPQYDDFMPQFTVEETIIYGSRMKNGFGTNHRKVADKVIEQLGLQVCRSNNIQRCSGGQRKRVAIAQELVSRPNILILDEPTSGLDSSCCFHTMKVLREVLDQSVNTEEPMAIVSTIHQPSAKVFKMFDSIYLLGKTGHMAYSGPPDELVSTIRDVTGLECPKYSNPSDFMIELVAYDYGDEPVVKLIEFEKQKAAQFKRDFEKRAGLKAGSSAATGPRELVVSANKQQKQTVERMSGAHSSRSPSIVSLGSGSQAPRLTPSKSDTHLAAGSGADLIQRRLKVSELLSSDHVSYANNVTVSLRKATSGDGRRHPFFWHTWIHLHRSFLQAIRDPILNNMRILIHLGFAILLVLLYGKKSGEARGCPPVLGLPQEIIDPNHESMIDLADNVGYLFMCIMMITYVSLMSTVLTFPIDIKTVGKEYKNGWYGTVTYFLGKTIADMPFIVLYPVVYCLITWYVTNQAQDHFWRYLSFTGLIIMNAMNSQSFGLILGALFVNSVTAATFLGPVITIPWYLFTGFTKRVHRLSEPFKTASKFLFTRYVFEGALDTVYGHNRCNCSEFLDHYYQLRFEEANRLGQLISMETLSSLDYYDGLETVANVVNETLFPPEKSANNWFERTVDAASTVFADGDGLNLASLMDTNVKASSMFSFGLDFEPTCPKDYESFVVQDFKIGEKNVQNAFLVVFCMLCVIRILTFVLVAWKIRTRQL